MNGITTSFNTGSVKPVNCIKEGWRLISDRYWLFFGLSFVGVFLGSMAPLGILLGPMMCGLYLCLLCRSRGGMPTFEMLFRGFEHFAESLIATLLMIVPFAILMVMVLFSFLGVLGILGISAGRFGPGMTHTMPGLIIALTIVVILLMLAACLAVGALFIFTFPLIADRGLSGVEALKTSARAVWVNLPGVLGLVCLNMLMGMIGITCCYIGALFIMPISLASHAVAYLHVFYGKDDSSGQISVNS
jgi:hypothetical protein